MEKIQSTDEFLKALSERARADLLVLRNRWVEEFGDEAWWEEFVEGFEEIQKVLSERQTMLNPKNKGKVGEREYADFLSQRGFPARRGQQFKGTPDSPDVVGGIPGTHAEVKRCERFNAYKALEQAIREAGEGEIPYVAHRQNRKEWIVVLRAEDFVEIVQSCLKRLETPPMKIGEQFP